MEQVSTINSPSSPWQVALSARRARRGQLCYVIPLLGNALPLAHLKCEGRVQKVSQQGIVIACSTKITLAHGSGLAVGIVAADERVKFTALVVDEVRETQNNCFEIVGHFGGALLNILNQGTLRPSFQSDDLRFEHTISEKILERLADVGILERTLVDRIHVCPSCGGMPSYRSVCLACHSPNILTDELIHHFACAHVASVCEFRDGSLLRCPKCQMGPLIVGSDFEYLPGLHTCLDCVRTGSQLQLRGKCLSCECDFPHSEAGSLDLVGYRPNRLDPAALTK